MHISVVQNVYFCFLFLDNKKEENLTDHFTVYKISHICCFQRQECPWHLQHLISMFDHGQETFFLSLKWILFISQFLLTWSFKLDWKILAAFSYCPCTYTFESNVCVCIVVFVLFCFVLSLPHLLLMTFSGS